MFDKKQFVQVSATFYLKNAPKGQLGLRQESWNFGKEPVPLERLIMAIVRQFVAFYAMVMPDSIDDINAAIQVAAKAIGELYLKEE